MSISFEVVAAVQENSIKLDDFLNSILSQTSLPSKVSLVGEENIINNYKSYSHEFASRSIDFKIIASVLNSSFQKNIGIKNISCDFIFFTEGDIKLDNSYFEQALNFFENDFSNNIGGITGCQTNFISNRSSLTKKLCKGFYLPTDGNGKILKSGFANRIDYSIILSGEIDWLPKSNMFLRKEVFVFDWFDENLSHESYYDDLDFSIRISKKFKLYYLTDAKFNKYPIHSVSNSKEEFYRKTTNIHYIFKKNFRLGINSELAHCISLIGFIFQSLFTPKFHKAIFGALKGFSEIVFLRNYTLPIYLERLDYSDFRQPSIAEHYVRYEYASNFCDGKVVLDCASGEGIGMNILCKSANEVYGVDIDENTFKTARANIKYNNAKLILGSATDLPFSDNFFDVITSMETLEHIPQKFQRKCINEFHRVLKPGGKLIISTPNKTVLNPKGIAPKNYFHLWEVTHVEFMDILLSRFSSVETNGLFNPLRQKINTTVGLNSEYKNKLSLKKKIMLMLPFHIKNVLSILLYKRKIYPLKTEYIIKADQYEYSNNLIFVATK